MFFMVACAHKPEPSANLIQRDCKIIARAPSAEAVDFSQPNMCLSYISGLISGELTSSTYIWGFIRNMEMNGVYQYGSDTPHDEKLAEHTKLFLSDLEKEKNERFCIAGEIRTIIENAENADDKYIVFKAIRIIYYRLAKVLALSWELDKTPPDGEIDNEHLKYFRHHLGYAFTNIYNHSIFCKALTGELEHKFEENSDLFKH